MPKYFYKNEEVEVAKVTSSGLIQLVDGRWIAQEQLQERKDAPHEKPKKQKASAKEEMKDGGLSE